MIEVLHKVRGQVHFFYIGNGKDSGVEIIAHEQGGCTSVSLERYPPASNYKRVLFTTEEGQPLKGVVFCPGCGYELHLEEEQCQNVALVGMLSAPGVIQETPKPDDVPF